MFAYSYFSQAGWNFTNLFFKLTSDVGDLEVTVNGLNASLRKFEIWQPQVVLFNKIALHNFTMENPVQLVKFFNEWLINK